jgi:hypothetical protein
VTTRLPDADKGDYGQIEEGSFTVSGNMVSVRDDEGRETRPPGAAAGRLSRGCGTQNPAREESSREWTFAHHPRCRVFKDIAGAVEPICAMQAGERQRRDKMQCVTLAPNERSSN